MPFSSIHFSVKPFFAVRLPCLFHFSAFRISGQDFLADSLSFFIKPRREILFLIFYFLPYYILIITEQFNISIITYEKSLTHLEETCLLVYVH